jgi:hypothetical protein
MDIVQNIKQYLLTNSLREAINCFYYVPACAIIDIYDELNTSLYGAMILEEESWDGSDLNSHISI